MAQSLFSFQEISMGELALFFTSIYRLYPIDKVVILPRSIKLGQENGNSGD
jgi:hypothetical protein